MMVRSGFGVRLNHDGTSPQLTGPCTRVRDSGSPRHSRALRCIGIEFPGPHNFHAVLLPVQCVPHSQIEGLRTEYPSTAFRMQVCYEGTTEKRSREGLFRQRETINLARRQQL